MNIHKLLYGTGLTIILSACQTAQHYNDLHGPETSLSDYGALEKAKGNNSSSANEDAILIEYAKRAGLGLPTNQLPSANDKNWQLIVQAGLNAIDEQCEAYMQAMFWADREMRTARDNVNLLGATTGTLMGVFGGPATAIATSAAAFGLATQALTNESKGLFFEIEPSGIRRIVSRSQTAYRQGVEERKETYNSRPAAVAALQGYLTLCLPAHIATQINQAVDSAKFQPADLGSTNPQVNVEQTKTNDPTVPKNNEQNNTDDSARSSNNGGRRQRKKDEPQALHICLDTNDCKNISKEEFVSIQAALCVEPSDIVDSDKTQRAINLFHKANKHNIETTLKNAGACPTEQFKNAYERFTYGNEGTYQTIEPDKVSLFIKSLLDAGIPISTPDDSSLNSLRKTIEEVEQQENMEGITGEVTPELIDILRGKT